MNCSYPTMKGLAVRLLLSWTVLFFNASVIHADFSLDFGSGLPFEQTFGQLTYLGEATSNFSEGLVRLVPSANDKVGVVWHRSKQQIVNGFSSTFNYAMDRGAQPLGGDGMAFVIQNISPFSAGFFRSGLGYTGISNSIAVEFDTIQNQSDLRDPNAGHIGINSRGKLSNTADHDLSTLAITGAFPNQALPLNDGNSRYVRVDYEPGFMTVYWDDATRPTTGAEVDLSQLLNVPEGRAYVGFTAATGLGNLGKQDADIFNWSFESLNRAKPETSLLNVNTSLSQLEIILEINDEPIFSLPGIKLEGTLNLETHWDDQKQIEGVRIMGARGGLVEEFNQRLQLGNFTIDALVTDDTTLTIFSGLDVAAVDSTGVFSLDSHVAQLIDGQIVVSDLGTIPGFADINVNMGVLKPTLPVPGGLFGQITLDEISSFERWATVTAPLRVGLGARTIAPNLRVNVILAGNIVAEGAVAVPEVSSATLVTIIVTPLTFLVIRRRWTSRPIA